MKYKILARFWGYSDYTPFIAKDAKHRDRIIKELNNDYAITSLKYCKLPKTGKKTEYIVLKGF